MFKGPKGVRLSRPGALCIDSPMTINDRSKKVVSGTTLMASITEDATLLLRVSINLGAVTTALKVLDPAGAGNTFVPKQRVLTTLLSALPYGCRQ